MLGVLAHHFILRERTVADPGACAVGSERETDGWYAASLESGRRQEGQPHSVLIGYVGASHIQTTYQLHTGDFINSNYNCHDTVIQHGSPVPPGIVLEGRDISRTSRGIEFSSSRKMLSFSTAPLDDRLFEIPENFKRDDKGSPTWREQLAYDWSCLERAFESWVD